MACVMPLLASHGKDQKQVLLVPPIISLLQIHRTIPRFWSAYNKSPCKQQGLFVKA